VTQGDNSYHAEIGKRERGNPAASFHGGVTRPLQILGQTFELLLDGAL